jgi:hypothetical protein
MNRKLSNEPFNSQTLSQHFEIGSMFAFLTEGLVRSFPWMGKLGLEKERLVLPYLREELRLPGKTIQLTELGAQPLASVTCDKALYSPDQTVSIFVYAPYLADLPVDLVMEHNGDVDGTRTVQLDKHGVAEVQLQSLRPGSCQAYLYGQDPEISGCKFSVAVFRLVPLVASLASRRMEGDTLHFELSVESFGSPVSGSVRLDLEDGNARIAQLQCEASKGLCAGVFDLQGDGPHTIQVQLVEEPEKTASVPIVGSRRSERIPTVFSALGPKFVGSLLPSGDCEEARGLFFERQGSVGNLFEVEQVCGTALKLVCRVEAECVTVTMIDPFAGTVEAHSVGDMKPDEPREIEVKSALTLVAIGAFTTGLGQGWLPYEGWTSVVRPSDLDLSLELPDVVVPGDDLVIRHPDPESQSLYVLVKDKRLASKDTPQSRLAGQLKNAVEKYREEFDTPVSDWARKEIDYETGALSLEAAPDLFAADEHVADSWGGGEVYDEGGWLGASDDGLFDEPAGGDMLFCEEPVECAFEEPEALALPSEVEAVVEPAAEPNAETDLDTSKTDEVPPQVVFAGIVSEAELRLKLPDISTDFVVEAFLSAGADWTDAQSTVQALQDPQLALMVPPFVHPQDSVRGRVLAQSSLGPVDLTLLRDGEAVTLTEDRTFPALPGRYEVTATASDGAQSRVTDLVQEPGSFTQRVRTLQFVSEGQTIELDDSIITLHLLPGLKQSLSVLMEATASYEHLCCEQTAAKMLGAISMYVFTPENRSQAESIFLSGAKRMETMVTRGGGFSMYPGGGGRCDYWGPLAVKHLYALGIFRNQGLSRQMDSAVSDCLQLADGAAGPHQVVWPPLEPMTASDCYWISRLSRNSRSAEAVERCLSGWQQLQEKSQGQVLKRSALAYASATLTRAGHLTEGLEIANLVTAELNEQGRLYSTVDSIAAICMMSELQSIGLSGGNFVFRLDGRDATSVDQPLPFKHLKVLQGTAIVEVERDILTSWEAPADSVPFTAELSGDSPLKIGQAVNLQFRLSDGYRDGDLLWVCLPDCLTRLEGGGQVKLFSVDLEGRSEVTVPLVTTAKTGEAGQHFAICLRNMFEEERIGNPGLQKVVVV